MSELNGKVAVISGASSPRGIGAAIAKRFAKVGASLFVIAEPGTDEQLATTVQGCRDLGAPRAESAVIDLTAKDGAERTIAEAETRFGRIDVLVNNAALRASYNFGAFTRETFDRVVAVNLASPFLASQAVLPEQQVRDYRYNGYLFPIPALTANHAADALKALERTEAQLGAALNKEEMKWRGATPWETAAVQARG
jgi:NAD(P)-dependent dehydrogenase (short-subunit alcohol dehydrogenase family)